MEDAVTVREEVHQVREVLEGAFSPEVATLMLFRALSANGAIPADRDETLALCRGSLLDVIGARTTPEVARTMLDRFERVLLKGDRSGTDVPLDVDLDPDATSLGMDMPAVWREAIVGIVVGAGPRFAEQLVAALGDERLRVSSTHDRASLDRALEACAPRLVVVDATEPPDIPADQLAATLERLPTDAPVVIWGAERDYADELFDADLDLVGVDQAEGIGPLLELVLQTPSLL